MSEVNNNENTNDLNDDVTEVIDDAEVMTVPIDDTLTVSGEAADAKAVGDALALKADKSELQTTVSVNGQTADQQGLIVLLAEHVPTGSGSGAPSVKAALETLDGKTAADIKMSSAAGAQTIAQAVSDAAGRTADQIHMSASDTTTVKTAVETVSGDLSTLAGNVSTLGNRTAQDIRYQAGSNETIKEHVDAMGSGTVSSVNGQAPDDNGNVQLNVVPYADNLYTDEMAQVDDTFSFRTTGGELGVSGVEAWILRLEGNRTHTGFVEEVLDMTVNAVPRTAPVAITATLDEATFEAYVEEAGTYTLEYDGEAWDEDPDDYGLTIANVPVDGDIITIVWDGSTDATVSITPGERTAPPAITATIDRATFVAYVASSGTITLSYTSSWSTDPALYGITVSNTPVSGDQIVVVYVKEVRGTITVATPSALVSTRWNLYNHSSGYAKVKKYSDTYGYKVGGTYSGLAFAETPTGTTTAITPDENGLFNVSGDGYVLVTGGNSSNTYILATWSDWTDGYEGDFETYYESEVDLSTIMSTYFPYGLCRVGDVRDEIDCNAKQAISRITRMAYSAENLAAVIAAGRAYEYDEDYIYQVRAEESASSITLTENYIISDHGLEWFTDTGVGVYSEILYGQNLKDKLRKDVLTSRIQSLTVGQKYAARTNIGLEGKMTALTLKSANAGGNLYIGRFGYLRVLYGDVYMKKTGLNTVVTLAYEDRPLNDVYFHALQKGANNMAECAYGRIEATLYDVKLNASSVSDSVLYSINVSWMARG